MQIPIKNLVISVVLLVIFSGLILRLEKMQKNIIPDIPRPKLAQRYGEFICLREIPISDNILNVLGTKGAILAEYENSEKEKFQVYILKASNKRSSIHQPEYCYLGASEELIQKGKRILYLDDQLKIPVNYLLVKKETGVEVVMYTYQVNKSYTNNYYWQQLLFLFQRLKRGSVNGCLIRVSKSSKNIQLSYDIKKLQSLILQVVKHYNP